MAGLIIIIAIYSFILVVESPIRRNLGVGGLELLSLFIAQYSEGSKAMEKLFEDWVNQLTPWWVWLVSREKWY